ncbi:MAG: hypothetical protein ACJ8IQ_09390 [Chthoniobacterales bacterium]
MPSHSADPLIEYADQVTVVVSSCDAFFDVWRPFAFFLRQFWGDCPLRIVLIVNELRISSRRITPLAVRPDHGWGTNLRIAVEQITTPYVLYVQEDYFFDNRIDANGLAGDFREMMELRADSLCFRARTHVERAFRPLNDRFGIVPIDSDGRSRNQVTLWRRDSLHSILRDGENGWDMERQGSERTRHMQVLSYARRDNTPIPYLMSAIVRGLWTPEALAMCHTHGVTIAPHFRRTYSQNRWIRGIRRSLTRRDQAHAIEQQRGRILHLDD